MSQNFILESVTLEKDGSKVSFVNFDCQNTYSHCLVILSTEGVYETEVKERGSLAYMSTLKIKRLENKGWQKIEHKAYSNYGNYDQACEHFIGMIKQYNPVIGFQYQIERALRRIGVSLDHMRSSASYNLEFGDWA